MPARQRAHDARPARPHRVAGGGVLHLRRHDEPLRPTSLPREPVLDCRHQHTGVAARGARRDAQGARQRAADDETRTGRLDVRQLRARAQNDVPPQARRNTAVAPSLRRPSLPHRPAGQRHGRRLRRRNGRLDGLGEQHALLRERAHRQTRRSKTLPIPLQHQARLHLYRTRSRLQSLQQRHLRRGVRSRRGRLHHSRTCFAPTPIELNRRHRRPGRRSGATRQVGRTRRAAASPRASKPPPFAPTGAGSACPAAGSSLRP